MRIGHMVRWCDHTCSTFILPFPNIFHTLPLWPSHTEKDTANQGPNSGLTKLAPQITFFKNIWWVHVLRTAQPTTQLSTRSFIPQYIMYTEKMFPPFPPLLTGNKPKPCAQPNLFLLGWTWYITLWPRQASQYMGFSRGPSSL